MRILFTKQFPLDVPGGEKNLLFALAQHLRALEAQVFMMPSTAAPTPANAWPEEFVNDVSPFGFHPVLDGFSLSRAAARFANQKQVDAVLSFQYETAYFRWFSQNKNVTLGVICAAPIGFLKQKASKNLLRRFIYHFFHFRMLRQADVVFTVSEFAKYDLIKSLTLDSEKIIVLPMGIDDVFQPSKSYSPRPLRNLIFHGSLEVIKGIYDVIESLGLLYDRGYREWNLKIAGWGDQAATLTFARHYGIQNQIRFLGILGKEQLAQEIASADLAILPSHAETFGLSIAEAAACGVPVVSYRIGGIPEVIQNGETGVLVEYPDQSQLASTIAHLIDHPEVAHEMGRKAQRFVRDKFSWQKSAELIVKCINTKSQ